MPIRGWSYQKTLSSRTVMVAWVGFCCQTTTASPAVAEAAKPASSPPSFERRASSRIGVSVTVLPSCVINLGETQSLNSQPVAVQCTRNTLYDIGVDEGSVQLSIDGLRSKTMALSDHIFKQSTGQQDTYTLQNLPAKQETLLNGDTKVTILSIDF